LAKCKLKTKLIPRIRKDIKYRLELFKMMVVLLAGQVSLELQEKMKKR